MGLFSGVLLLPLTPVRGVGWVADRLLEAADRELYDPAVLRAQLGELNRAYEEGELDEDEFEQEENRLLDLLEQRAPTVVTRASSRPGAGPDGALTDPTEIETETETETERSQGIPHE
ncbi:gas vesicle protein GvpG [Streptomyces sp. N2-109]|uniref:Gas vesicle protein GvpG n=1 Tax=Streptomyces gossypii TaxID=2883101 RepID=A0ABT2K3M4_9ACTN|nr:gas vesicle protein GvpG [Streptomyces gossypii]MCT2594758.1 gas vesicle protein GvpG [Streptomyces gossypii]